MQISKATSAVAGAIRGWLPDVLLMAGAGAVSYGASLIYPPAGYLVAGGFALAAGWLLAREV